MLRIVAAMMAMILATPCFAQATSRPCTADESPGPACLLAHVALSALPPAHVYWHLDTFPNVAVAETAKTVDGVVVSAFGNVWLFTIADKDWRPHDSMSAAMIGPLPVTPATGFVAEYLRSVFPPGKTAPLHIHSGPEAFYAVSGDTCLETPDGVQIARGPGNSLFVRGGPPMLLKAIGASPRRGFALILHDPALPATTLIHDWSPKGLCNGR